MVDRPDDPIKQLFDQQILSNMEKLTDQAVMELKRLLPQSVVDGLEPEHVNGSFLGVFSGWLMASMGIDLMVQNREHLKVIRPLHEELEQSVKAGITDVVAWGWTEDVESGAAPREPWMGDKEGDDLQSAIEKHAQTMVEQLADKYRGQHLQQYKSSDRGH